MKTSLKIKHKIDREFLASLIMLVPYLESSFIVRISTLWIREDVFIRPTSLATIIIFVTVIVLGLGNRITIKRTSLRLGATLSLLSFVGVYFSKDHALALAVWIMSFFPLLTSILLTKYFVKCNYDIRRIILGMIDIFIIYTAFIVIYSIPAYKLFINPIRRLAPRGGGPVIFGYTVAIIFSLCMIYKDQYNKVMYYMRLSILTVGAIATMARASVWPVMCLWVLNFLIGKKTSYRRIVIAFCLLPITFILVNIDYSSLMTDTFLGTARLFNIASSRRSITAGNLLLIFSKSSLIYKTFGFGVGSFFPYMNWVAGIHDVEHNMFDFAGYLILVQPHNTFLYILMELGVIGEILLLGIFGSNIFYILKKHPSSYMFRVIFLVVVIFVNNFDSLLLIEPGVALVIWLLLFLVEEEGKNSLMNAELIKLL